MTGKEKLIEECRTLVMNSWSHGGITNYNEYNQFLCDVIGELIPFLSVEGLKRLKEDANNVRDSMPDEDKI